MLHAAVIGWMFLGPPLDQPGRARAPRQARNLYQQEIAPQERKLVWYNFRDKLPEVSPLERHGISRPPKTEAANAKQTIVARPKNAPKAKQMVWLPAPRVTIERELDSPNMLAFEAPKLPPPEYPRPKPFQPPPDAAPAPEPAPALPDAPQVAAAGPKPALPSPDTLSKPKPREFVPPQEAKRPPQPAPALPEAPAEVAAAKLPDLVPAEPPRLKPREFVPPREAIRSPQAEPPLPEAPAEVAAKLPALVPAEPPRLKPRAFVPPRETRRSPAPAPPLPDAPTLAASSRQILYYAPPPPELKPRVFVPPREARRSPAPAPSLPEAPNVASATALFAQPRTPLPPKLKPRAFTPPREAASDAAGSPSLPTAPQIAGTPAQPELPRVASLAPRMFVPPPQVRSAPNSAAIAEAAPPLESSAPGGNLTAAIVGLNPAATLAPPALDGSRPANLSSGPEKRKEGGTGEPVESARIFVPDLMVRDGQAKPAPSPAPVLARAIAPTSIENLRAAIHSSPLLPQEIEARGAAVAHNAPDPRLQGRIVYNVAIQMPNVTSYIGSWIMWFAEREPLPGRPPEMTPPVPLHKVDPKYHPSAVAERVEGKVLLSAVIEKDGRVDSVVVTKHLDDRLDFAAQQALKQWEFSPALRNAEPVAVDAVFEIPFRLAPLATK